MGQSYIVRTAEGKEIFLLNTNGLNAAEGEKVTIQKGLTTVHGTVTRKYQQRNRPARQRRGR